MGFKGAVACQQLELTPACTCILKHMHTAGLRFTKDVCLLIYLGNRAFLLPGIFVIQDENPRLLSYGKLWSISLTSLLWKDLHHLSKFSSTGDA